MVEVATHVRVLTLGLMPGLVPSACGNWQVQLQDSQAGMLSIVRATLATSSWYLGWKPDPPCDLDGIHLTRLRGRRAVREATESGIMGPVSEYAKVGAYWFVYWAP